MRRHIRHLLIVLLLTAAASAQQPAAPAQVSRLQQMEVIYQKELSARHIPLLGKYLTELQRQAATAADRAAYDAEIARIQQIISSGGVLDLIAVQKTQLGEMPTPAPMSPPVPLERKEALIALSPALAQNLAPPAGPDAATAMLGEAEWRIEAISAGTYDVLLHYACPELTEPLSLSVEFAGQKIEKALEIERVTKDARTFRIFRLGSLTLTGDHRGETLRLTAGDKNAPKLSLKSLLITKPRPPAN
jgi:hypothetical protein